MTLLDSALMLLVIAQVGTDLPVATIHSTPQERLAYMQQGGASYKVTINEGEDATFVKEPVLRFTNPVSGVVDGGLFVWQDKSKRPVAAAQLFIAPKTDMLWIHEFQSLAEASMRFEYKGRPVWTPKIAGVAFKPLAAAPPPAKSKKGRLVQMRQLARRFSIKDDFEGASKDALRLMATPLVRYSDKSAKDGALFTFAHGTDPELLVLLEARKASPEEDEVWHVALAPMTAYAITAELDNQEYWSVAWRKAPHPITAAFKNFVYPPEEEVPVLQRLFGR